MIRQKSLQRELSRGIIITALVFVFIGGAIAGSVVFNQVRELQDHTLLEIAKLVSAGKLNDSATLHHDIEKETIIINEFGKKQHVPVISSDTKDGLHTMQLDGHNWRILVITQPKSQRRFSISQPTKLRDEIALSSSLSAFLPMILLVIMMLIIIQIIISRQFRSIGKLAKTLDQQEGLQLHALSNKDIPIEIAPFVNSINGLFTRVGRTIKKQQRFIADAAHELRTPITALSLQVENVEQAKTEADRDKRQEKLKQGLGRLRNLVSQLLNLARLQTENDTPKIEVSFNQIVTHAIADLYPLAEKANIDIGMLRQEENIKVNDQQEQLAQLVYNAIDNAIHYSKEKGKIDISLFIENNKAVYLVEDNGIGIPEDQLEQVLQPFYRVQEGNQSGNGLGLAISHEIAERLNGQITLSNRKSGGLCFRYEQGLI